MHCQLPKIASLHVHQAANFIIIHFRLCVNSLIDYRSVGYFAAAQFKSPTSNKLIILLPGLHHSKSSAYCLAGPTAILGCKISILLTWHFVFVDNTNFNFSSQSCLRTKCRTPPITLRSSHQALRQGQTRASIFICGHGLEDLHAMSTGSFPVFTNTQCENISFLRLWPCQTHASVDAANNVLQSVGILSAGPWRA
jgi:hypothetical protein